MIHWKDISYLKSGNQRQLAAYATLRDLKIFDILRPYDPILTGTVPIDIDIPGSDLDLVCEVQDADTFTDLTTRHFGDQPAFRSERRMRDSMPTVVTRFETGTFPVEVFAQPRPVTEQRAYRHMVIEARLLEIGGAPARSAIRQLKLDGLKTEPAFASYFQIPQDPYEQLYRFYDWDDRKLREAVASGDWTLEST